MILLDGHPGAVEHADEEIGKGHAAGELVIMAVLVAKVFAARNDRWIMLAPMQRTGGAAVEDYGVVQQGTVLASALAHLVEKGAEPGQEELIPKAQLFELVGDLFSGVFRHGCGDHFWSICGSFWNQFGSIFGYFWGPVWSLWAPKVPPKTPPKSGLFF